MNPPPSMQQLMASGSVGNMGPMFQQQLMNYQGLQGQYGNRPYGPGGMMGRGAYGMQGQTMPPGMQGQMMQGQMMPPGMQGQMMPGMSGPMSPGMMLPDQSLRGSSVSELGRSGTSGQISQTPDTTSSPEQKKESRTPEQQGVNTPQSEVGQGANKTLPGTEQAPGTDAVTTNTPTSENNKGNKL